MFIGEFHHNLDAKGRIVLPTKFREELHDTVIVTKGLDGCLNVYTSEAWQTIYEKLLTLPTTNRDARMYVRMLTAKASECTFDTQGRILLPANLIGDEAITKECVVVGAADHVEIWSEERWNNFEEEGSENLDEIAERLASFGI